MLNKKLDWDQKQKKLLKSLEVKKEKPVPKAGVSTRSNIEAAAKERKAEQKRRHRAVTPVAKVLRCNVCKIETLSVKISKSCPTKTTQMIDDLKTHPEVAKVVPASVSTSAQVFSDMIRVGKLHEYP